MKILWVDDRLSEFSGTRYTLEEVMEDLKIDVDIEECLTFDAAERRIKELGKDCNLLIFDMILSKPFSVASERRLGMSLIPLALPVGIRRFLSFSVLPASEIDAAWEEIKSTVGLPQDVVFRRLRKSECSPIGFINEVKRLLDIR